FQVAHCMVGLVGLDIHAMKACFNAFKQKNSTVHANFLPYFSDYCGPCYGRQRSDRIAQISTTRDANRSVCSSLFRPQTFVSAVF
ncbi:MAG: hypothetical protein ACK4NS_11770, partial [Saprospiraceae bacterium]